MLEQRFRDTADGLDTAGYVTGYRGSPLGAVDMQMQGAQPQLEAANVVFQPALNEDLAATALWGAQQAELRNEGRHDGVFGLWYGKGPGVDRSGDALRHANLAGTSRHGGVVMALGDDHTGESSTTLHQSELALVDAGVPILSPAGVQEILDYGILAYGLSRFTGNWVGLKCVKETVESTAVVDGDPGRFDLRRPEIDLPPGGLNIRLVDDPRAQEARLVDHRLQAAGAYWRSNRGDRRVLGSPGARVGLVSSGKSWLDLVHALELLGLDAAAAESGGITTYKIGMVWPLDVASLLEWTEGLELVVVVEEKRKLIESQIKDAVFDRRRQLRVIGRHDEDGREIFPVRMALEPVMIARAVGSILEREGRTGDRVSSRLTDLRADSGPANSAILANRHPYFCSGCPHNSSTRIPEGSRAYAGIGCHYMVQWMDRQTTGFTQMGGEGGNWIGESPFSTTDHVFQNIGDGTFNHSGIMAIRASVAADVNVTFKILYNDAVAMTGGQKNDGNLTAARIARELVAIGPKKVVLVYDRKEDIDFSEFPAEVERRERSELDPVQKQLRQIGGVTAILYVQTCAAEKRRRRKRGTFPDIDRRVFINPDICDGCGDCGVQSNCMSIVPLETPAGRKRVIDQSGCNKDFSCLDGFCPSFVTIQGARPRRREAATLELPELPLPVLPEIDQTHNLIITGIGGTGVVTIGAILSTAAHLDGKGAGMIEMAGLAQKGGAVTIHCRIADSPADISAIRVARGEAHGLLGGDLVVTAHDEVLDAACAGKTRAVVNSHEFMTGEFTRDTEFRIPGEDLRQRLGASLGEGQIDFLDATQLARKLLGDAIHSNMIILGHAWQSACIPLSLEAIMEAVTMNGAGIETNKRAFALGRWAALHAEEARRHCLEAETLPGAADRQRQHAEHLTAHSGPGLARRYLALLERCPDPGLRSAVADGYHRLLAVKDEYEVARLHLATEARARAEFEGSLRISYHLAPPLPGRKRPDGRPQKREFGPWVIWVFRLLVRLKRLRGSPLDPFRYSAERRLQRRFLREYEQDIDRVLARLDRADLETACELARLPLEVKGFGPVWEGNYHRSMRKRQRLLTELGIAGQGRLAEAVNS